MPDPYTPGALWTIILAGGLGTLAIRLSFVLLLGRMEEIPRDLLRVLRFVPSAVLTALVVPAVVYDNGALVLTLGNSKLMAGTVAALVAWRTHSVIATIGVGMLVLWGLMFI